MTSDVRGFSLIELVIVVGVVGLLSAVGIPSFQKFQARTRTAEAKSALSALYTAEKSFNAEWNQYTVDLRNIGFAVSGNKLRYITGFLSGSACTGYSVAQGPVEDVWATWSDSPAVNSGSPAATFNNPSNPNDRTAVMLGANAQCIANASFLANAHGDPRNTPVAADNFINDSWTIDQNKLIQQVRVGF